MLYIPTEKEIIQNATKKIERQGFSDSIEQTAIYTILRQTHIENLSGIHIVFCNRLHQLNKNHDFTDFDKFLDFAIQLREDRDNIRAYFIRLSSTEFLLETVVLGKSKSATCKINHIAWDSYLGDTGEGIYTLYIPPLLMNFSKIKRVKKINKRYVLSITKNKKYWINRGSDES